LVGVGVGVVAVAVILLVMAGGGSSNPGPAAASSPAAPTSRPPKGPDPATLPGIQTGQADWPPESAHLADRLRAIGLQPLPHEFFKIHIHQHIDIYIGGHHLIVPQGIGFGPNASFLSAIHTHDTSGIIHVESPTVRTYTLGEFFDVWGVLFTKQCLGEYCTNAQRTLKVFVNGTPVAGDPSRLVLESHQEIVVTYDMPAEMPKPIPSSYTFPSGY
jgi:hypothetical protein